MLNENSLFIDQQSKDIFVNDKTKFADVFWVNILGFLALKSYGSNPQLDLYFRKDKVQLSSITDDSNDLTLIIKLAYDNKKILLPVATGLTKLLALIKQDKIQQVDENLVRDLLNKITISKLKPSGLIFKEVKSFLSATSTLKDIIKPLFKISKTNKINDDFIRISKLMVNNIDDDPVVSNSVSTIIKQRGRPKGSLNKKTISSKIAVPSVALTSKDILNSISIFDHNRPLDVALFFSKIWDEDIKNIKKLVVKNFNITSKKVLKDIFNTYSYILESLIKGEKISNLFTANITNIDLTKIDPISTFSKKQLENIFTFLPENLQKACFSRVEFSDFENVDEFFNFLISCENIKDIKDIYTLFGTKLQNIFDQQLFNNIKFLDYIYNNINDIKHFSVYITNTLMSLKLITYSDNYSNAITLVDPDIFYKIAKIIYVMYGEKSIVLSNFIGINNNNTNALKFLNDFNLTNLISLTNSSPNDTKFENFWRIISNKDDFEAEKTLKNELGNIINVYNYLKTNNLVEPFFDFFYTSNFKKLHINVILNNFLTRMLLKQESKGIIFDFDANDPYFHKWINSFTSSNYHSYFTNNNILQFLSIDNINMLSDEHLNLYRSLNKKIFDSNFWSSFERQIRYLGANFKYILNFVNIFNLIFTKPELFEKFSNLDINFKFLFSLVYKIDLVDEFMKKDKEYVEIFIDGMYQNITYLDNFGILPFTSDYAKEKIYNEIKDIKDIKDISKILRLKNSEFLRDLIIDKMNIFQIFDLSYNLPEESDLNKRINSLILNIFEIFKKQKNDASDETVKQVIKRFFDPLFIKYLNKPENIELRKIKNDVLELSLNNNIIDINTTDINTNSKDYKLENKVKLLTEQGKYFKSITSSNKGESREINNNIINLIQNNFNIYNEIFNSSNASVLNDIIDSYGERGAKVFKNIQDEIIIKPLINKMIYDPDVIIKPQKYLSFDELQEVLRVNNFNISDINIRKEKNETYIDYLKRLQVISNKIIDEKLKLKISTVNNTVEDLERKRGELLTYYTKEMKHGNVAIKILEEYNSELVFDEYKDFQAKFPSPNLNPGFHGTGTLGASMITRFGFKVMSSKDSNKTGIGYAGRLLRLNLTLKKLKPKK